jgi:hypothetical protein
MDAPKSILETEKTLKTLSSGQIYKKKTPQKTQKNPLGWFFFKNPGFFQPCLHVNGLAAPEPALLVEEFPVLYSHLAHHAGGGGRPRAVSCSKNYISFCDIHFINIFSKKKNIKY